MPDVPPIDVGPPKDPTEDRQRDIEFRVLEADARAKESQNREADQRYRLRWLTVIVALLIISVMIGLLFHMSHQILIGPILIAPTAYAMTLVIAPIASTTAIVLTLFVAAFRGFKKSDEGDAASAAADGARAAGLVR